MIAVPRNHFLQLFEAVLHDLGRRLIGHSLERIRAPGWDFRLNQNSMPVAIIKDTLVLRPVDPRKNTVEFLQIVVVMIDPRCRLSHAEFRIAAGHALDSHQSNTLAIKVKRALLDLNAPNSTLS